MYKSEQKLLSDEESSFLFAVENFKLVDIMEHNFIKRMYSYNSEDMAHEFLPDYRKFSAYGYC